MVRSMSFLLLTWKVIEGKTSVKARSAVKGFVDTDLQPDPGETAGCVSLRPSHFQLVSLCAVAEWEIWILDIRNACLQADSHHRDVYVRAPPEWVPFYRIRAWKLREAAYG